MSQNPLHILLADDDDDDRLSFKDAFEELKVKTVVTMVNERRSSSSSSASRMWSGFWLIFFNGLFVY